MNEERFHSLFLPLAGPLYKVAFYILESQADAEDAVQDVFLKLWAMRGSLEGISNPKAYAMTMLRNTCLDRIRAAGRISDAPIPDSPAPGPDPETEIDDRQRLEKVLAAVKSLPERQRQVLILHTVDGLSYEEISRRTGINYLSLRVMLSKARKTLKTMI
ncbi:MAG: RNA polymerase sigma factor [Bacteroidales bacterium]|nr:RNA polymerase sigma factor [Bacteroidales bacterium]